MKRIISIILLTFLIQVSFQDAVCPIFKCAEKSLQGDLCYKDRGNGLTELQKCSSGEVCDFKRDSSTFCAKYLVQKDIDDKCTHNEDCINDNCVDSLCKAKPIDNCIYHYQCSKSQYCGFSNCKPLLPAGTSCINISDSIEACEFDHVCSSFICVKMYSVETGETASNASACKSNFVHNKVCAESEPVNGDFNKECNTDVDCPVKISYNGKTPDETVNGKCECSYNGKKYCSATTKDPVWQDYLKTYAKKVTGIDKAKIRIMTERFTGWGNEAIYEAKKRLDKYSKLKNADDCAVQYILSGVMLKSSIIGVIGIVLGLF